MKRCKYFSYLILTTILLTCISIPAIAELTIWANSGEDKVTRDELRGATDSSAVINNTWDGSKITLFGAKNEVVAFNLILESPASAASNVTVTFDTLSGPGGASITSTPATGNGVFNWVNRNIELFYVRYLEIKGVSTDLFFAGFNYDERHIPERFRRPWTGEGEGTGSWTDRPDHNKFYPDIAVPLELVNQFNIAANQNQSIWVDIYIPKTVSAGLFTGTIVISENGTQVAAIPVELTIKNFSLPDLPTARTMLVYSHENINQRYLGNSYVEEDSTEYTQSLALIDTHFKVAHRHRISLINNWVDVDRVGLEWNSRLTGSLFTSQNGYDGPGVGIGNNIYSIGTYSSWPWYDGTKADMWTNTNAWVDWFDAQTFTTPTEYFLYLIDESTDYAQTEKWAQWINSNPGSGSRLMSFATIDLTNAVTNTPSLDIPAAWVQMAISEQYQSAADNIKADPNKRLYLYNGGRPGTGSFATEDEGVSPRVIAWTQYKLKVDRWFYWESTYYNNYQGEMGETNVFRQAQTYGSFERVDQSLGETGWDYLNGDGVLFYPGTDTQYPGDSYGVNGPFASLRLKHWRRGLQDFEYLTMAAAINSTQTGQIVNQMIPKVAWEVSVSSIEDPTWVETDISWSVDPDDWEKARKDLADIISQNPSILTPTKLYYPHVASNGIWETEICIINTSSTGSMKYMIKAYKNDGTLSAATASITLTPFARHEITVGTYFSNPSDIGYIVVESNTSSCAGYTKFFVSGSNRVAVPATIYINSNDINISHVASSGNWWTGLSLVNTNTTAKTLRFEFSTGETKSLTLGAGEHKAITVAGLFGGTAKPSIKCGIIKNASGIVGLELFGTKGSGTQLSGVLLNDKTVSTLYFPHIASNNTWWTGISVYNPSSANTILTITSYNSAGTSLGSQQITVEGKSKYIGTAAALGLPSGTGWFLIESTSPVTGFELFGTKDEKQLAGYTAVELQTTSGVFPKLEKDGWTGIAFVNTDGSQAAITLTAYDNAGTQIASEAIQLGTYAKLVKTAKNIFSSDISNATYVYFSSTSQIVGFQLNGSTNDMMLDGLPGK